MQVKKKGILDTACSNRFADTNPYQIVAILLEEGTYIASPSSFYRVLREHELIHHRWKGRPGNRKAAPAELIATGPSQVWGWEITYLKTGVSGIYLYAYVIIDV